MNTKLKKFSACLAVCAAVASFGSETFSYNHAEAAKVTKEDKAKAKALYPQCVEKFDNNDVRGAAACFMEADKYAKEEPLYKILSGDSLRSLKQYPSAIRYYEGAVDVATKDKKMKDKIRQKAYIGLAESYAETDNMEKALEYASKSIKEFPEDYRGHYVKGLVLQKKDKQAAIDEFKKSIKVDKTQYNSYVKLIGLYKELGQIDNAIQTYKEAIDYRPLDEDMKMALAQLYISETKKEGSTVNYYPQAIDVLTSLTNVNNRNAQAHYFLSTLYLLQNDKERSFQELATTSALNAGLGSRLNKEIEAYEKNNNMNAH